MTEVAIEKLKHYPGNARRGNVPAIMDSLRENGQYKPLIVQKSTGYVLVGNHTLDAATELGWKKVKVEHLDCSDEEARKIVLADNRTSDLAGYDDRALADLLADVDELSGTGYTADDFAEILARTADLAAPEESVPEPPEKPITKRGDLIGLGRHVLLCGDSSDEAEAAKLLGEPIDMIWTDPPYGVNVHEIANQRADRNWAEMNADTMNAAELEAFLTPVFALAAKHAVSGCPIYIAHADQMREPVRAAMLRAGFSHRQTLVWVKNSLVIGRQDYQWRHEPILYGWKAGTHRWYGQFDKTTIIDQASKEGNISALSREDLIELVWKLVDGEPGTAIRIDRPTKSVDHPTMKPIDLIAGHIANSCPVDGNVYDPFGGSGSTLIAAEQLGRCARLIELDPGYCDVIVERWQQLTGKTAKRPRRR